jgi:hypothetical protein
MLEEYNRRSVRLTPPCSPIVEETNTIEIVDDDDLFGEADMLFTMSPTQEADVEIQEM